MLTHLDLPRQGHLEKVIHVFGYIKSHNEFRLMFDSDDTNISDKRLKSFDPFDFYKDVEEEIHPDMP